MCVGDDGGAPLHRFAVPFCREEIRKALSAEHSGLFKSTLSDL